MIAATYYVSWNSDVVRTWLYARLTVAAVGVMAIMPSVVGCCDRCERMAKVRGWNLEPK